MTRPITLESLLRPTGYAPATDRGEPWETRAACRTSDPETFFDPAMIEQALATCANCPVTAECLAATAPSDQHSIRAGMTPAERSAARRRESPRRSTLWTPEEDAIATRPDLTIAQAAQLLPGRTPSAISARRARIACADGSRRWKTWQPWELDLLDADLTATQISERTGRTVYAIYYKRWELRTGGAS